MTRKAKRKSLGSTGCQPVVFGSLPKIIQREAFNKGVIVTHNAAGKLPATAACAPQNWAFVIISSFVIRHCLRHA